MSARGDVAPSTVGIELLEHGVQVEYLDGRTTLYHGVPRKVDGPLRTGPGKETHVLVTDQTETEGVMIYVNDRNTHDEILEASGVGRVMLEGGESTELFPGVTVRRLPGERNEIEAEPSVARGRVLVFVEDEWDEQSYELVGPGDEEGVDGDDDTVDRGAGPDADGTTDDGDRP